MDQIFPLWVGLVLEGAEEPMTSVCGVSYGLILCPGLKSYAHYIITNT